MPSGPLESLATGTIDLGSACIEQPTTGTLSVVAKADPSRYALAMLCLAVASFTVWHTWLDYVSLGPWGLLPGICIVPVFITLTLLLAFFEQHKRIDARARKAIAAGRFLGFAARVEIDLPDNGHVRLSASTELAGSEQHGVSRVLTFHMDVGSDGGLGFTLKQDREAATAFAQQLAAMLNYTLLDDIEADDSATWRTLLPRQS